MTTTDDRCVHELAPNTCSICRRSEARGDAEGPEPSECKACGADILWVRSEKGKSLPIDIDPGGDPAKARFRKERTERDGAKVRGIVHFVRDSELAENVRPLYCCHFDTCSARRKDDARG